jgi:hypothetical protein
MIIAKIFTRLFPGVDYMVNVIKHSVVMNAEAYAQRESALRLRESLLRAEADIKHGRVYSAKETADAMKRIIAETADAGK